MGPKPPTAWSPSPSVTPATACAPGLLQQQQQGKAQVPVEGGVECRQNKTSPQLPLSPPPPLLGVSSTSSVTPTPPLLHGPTTTTSGSTVAVRGIEPEKDDDNQSGGNVTARETNRHVGVPPLPVAHTKDDGDLTTAATTQQQQENQQWHRRQQPQTPLSSTPSSSPSLLCRYRPTRQNEEEKPAGGGGGDDEGKYRSICSCPAIGAADVSPLLARHELTDRSALERSQRLVSVFSCSSIYVHIRNITRRRCGFHGASSRGPVPVGTSKPWQNTCYPRRCLYCLRMTSTTKRICSAPGR